jgi:hypothetical protein
MLMSLSSLDSKTSRHSRHSTNSASSSRLTICTRGCLQGFGSVLGGRGNGFELINPEAPSFKESLKDRCAGISRYFSPAFSVVKSLLVTITFNFENFECVSSKPFWPNLQTSGPNVPRWDKPFTSYSLHLRRGFPPLRVAPCAIRRPGRRMKYDEKGRN